MFTVNIRVGIWTSDEIVLNDQFFLAHPETIGAGEVIGRFFWFQRKCDADVATWPELVLNLYVEQHFDFNSSSILRRASFHTCRSCTVDNKYYICSKYTTFDTSVRKYHCSRSLLDEIIFITSALGLLHRGSIDRYKTVAIIIT